MSSSDQGGRARASARGDAATLPEAASFAVSASEPLVSANSGLHRLLVDSVRDYAIFALDTHGNVLSWNAGAKRIKGYEAHEIIGRHFSNFYPEEDKAARKPERELEEAIRDGRTEDEGWRIRKDGTRFWANVVITALRDASGVHVGFAKVTRDLSERRAAEEALRESEERFRLLVHSVKDYGIFMLDPHGHIASWNEGAARIKGYAAGEIIGRHFSIFYPQEDNDAGKPAWELEVASEEGRFEDEGWRLRKDGTRFWANVIITALRNSKGTLIGFAKVTRDLTERVAAEAQAISDARRIAAAEGASRAKSEFLAALSHELRTPLNAIGGYADLLAVGVAGDVNEQQHGYLQRIRGSQQHLLGIINDLLNYSRLEAGVIEYDIAPVAVERLLDEVFLLVEPQAIAKELQLERPSTPADVRVLADRIKAEQVLLNLLTNAVKFTPAGGRISAEYHVEGDTVRIGVRDTGPGIPAERQAAVFEPFVQLGRTLRAPLEGVGLGLAISRDLARAMQGEIELVSAEGSGSLFTLLLPLAR